MGAGRGREKTGEEAPAYRPSEPSKKGRAYYRLKKPSPQTQRAYAFHFFALYWHHVLKRGSSCLSTLIALHSSPCLLQTQASTVLYA